MKKIVELRIDAEELELDGLGVDIMSLVNNPAIGINWQAFAQEAFVEPQADESKEEYISRCIPALIGEGYPEDQAGAICYASWDDKDKFELEVEDNTEAIQDFIIEMASSDEFGEEYDPEQVIMIDGTQTKFDTIGDYLKGVQALDILGRRVKKDEAPQRKFRYSGPLAQRNFCKAMQRMRKLYTRKEIDEMSSRVNTGFRHDGQSYSIFNFKGGVNCKHYWEELDVFRSENGQLIMISHGPASGRAGQAAGPENNYWRHPNSRFSFNEEQRIIVGPAMVPQILIPRRDSMGNIFHVYFSKETIKHIAEKFLAENRHNNTDVNHDDNVVTNNTLLESWIVEDPQYDKSKLYGFDVVSGTWMVSYKINDEETWQKIKSGELRGYSVAGNFIEKLAKA